MLIEVYLFLHDVCARAIYVSLYVKYIHINVCDKYICVCACEIYVYISVCLWYMCVCVWLY